jgi:hypothetical protein
LAAVLFPQRLAGAIADGTMTLTFRRWKRSQAKVGNRYRTPGGFIDVDAVDVVGEDDITDGEARRAGFASAAELIADLPPPPGGPVYRIAFHHADVADPRAELAASADLTPADVLEIDRRLDRLDRASSHGPWTGATLRIIEARPERRAADLAAALGRARDPFKVDVRKLKNLGLTLSLEVGYRLSPRGVAYLQASGRGAP